MCNLLSNCYVRWLGPLHLVGRSLTADLTPVLGEGLSASLRIILEGGIIGVFLCHLGYSDVCPVVPNIILQPLSCEANGTVLWNLQCHSELSFLVDLLAT